MKVLLVINGLGYGGAERLVFNFVSYSRNEHSELEVEICTLLYLGDLGKKLQKMGITVHNLSCKKWDVLKIVWKLYNLVSKGEYDIVHVHLFPTLYYVSIIRRLITKPIYIYTEHSTWNRRRKYFLLKLMDAFAYKAYDYIVANSDDTKKALVSWLPFTAQKTEVIENAIPPVKSLKHQYSISKPASLLFVGRLVAAKGVDVAIDAVRLLEKQGIRVKLTVVGDGPERAKLERQSKGLNVRFLGYQSNPTEIMAEHDILIIPSRWEGFGLVAIEGMSVGIPVIASCVPGLTRVIQDGKTGLLFPPEDKKALAAAIKRLLIDKNLREQIGRNGRNESSKIWSMSRFVRETVKLYESSMKSYKVDGDNAG